MAEPPQRPGVDRACDEDLRQLYLNETKNHRVLCVALNAQDCVQQHAWWARSLRGFMYKDGSTVLQQCMVHTALAVALRERNGAWSFGGRAAMPSLAVRARSASSGMSEKK